MHMLLINSEVTVSFPGKNFGQLLSVVEYWKR